MIAVNREVKDSCLFQVVVVGGGPAGWIAAIAAARQGARTALIERLGFLGGTATAGLVVPVSGFFKQGERVVGGIPWEFIQSMLALKAAQLEMPKGHISVDTEIYKLVAQRLLQKSGVTFFSNTVLTDVIRNGRRLEGVIAEGRDGAVDLQADCFIDATGNANLCEKAGIATRMPSLLQPMSLCFELCGVDVSTPLLKDYIHHDGLHIKNSCQADIHAYLDALRLEGRAPQFGGPWFNTLLHRGHLAVNITRHAAMESGNMVGFAQAEMQLREDMFTLVELLKEHYAEFRNCAIVASGVNAGVRDGRHVIGLHTLTADELMTATPFADAIARNAHPMDIHIAGATSQSLKAVPQSGYIPYRSLVSSDCDNLLVAGRAIDADDGAHASIRVQGTVMAIGEAAGTAAAMSALTGTSVERVDMADLQRRLRQNGCIL